MSRARELYHEFQPLSCVENRKNFLQRTLPWCLRLVLAGVFFYAGCVKVKDPTLFAIKIRNYELLSDPWVALVALSLPWLELFSAVGVMMRKWERGALLWIIAMLVVFLFGLLSAMVRGLDIDCGCFTAGLDRGSLAVAVATDLVLLLIAVRLLFLHSREVQR